MLSTATPDQPGNTVNIVPTDSDGKPIIWSDLNPASLEVVLDEIGKCLDRTGLFHSLYTTGAVLVGTSGKLAVDSAEAVPFLRELRGEELDTYTFKNPCPPTAKRVSTYAASPRGDKSPAHEKPDADGLKDALRLRALP